MTEPWILLNTAPDNHCHGAAGFETFAHVAQACHRILEELRTKTREAKIVDRLEMIGLHVRFQESHVRNARGSGIAAPVFQKSVAAVDGKDRSAGSNQTGKLDRSVA